MNTSPDEVCEMLETKKKVLVTCSVFDSAHQVQLWNVVTYEKIAVIEDISTCGGRDLCQLSDDIICVSGSGDGEGLQLISISKKAKIKQIKDFSDNKFDAIYVKNGQLLIGTIEMTEDGNEDEENEENCRGGIKLYSFDEKKLEFNEISSKEKCHNFPTLGFYELSNGTLLSMSKEVIVWK